MGVLDYTWSWDGVSLSLDEADSDGDQLAVRWVVGVVRDSTAKTTQKPSNVRVPLLSIKIESEVSWAKGGGGWTML